jgi:trimethylamine---corrinoid protein Co-methyltransferase
MGPEARRESTRSHRPRMRAAASAAPPVDRGRHGGITPAYDLLPLRAVETLIESAVALLGDSGCAFEAGTEAIDLFGAAGCKVTEQGVVRIPAELVRSALESTARSAKLWDRCGTHCIELDTAHTWFMPGMTCIKVYDLENGAPRTSTAADLAQITRLADALPNIDGACVSCKDVPHSDIHGEINEFAILIQNTSKPLEYLCENAESFAVAIELAAAVRGSRQALEEKPYFLQIVTPLPLAYWRTHSDQVILGARAGIPVSVGTLPIGGASTPITVAGCMVNSLATDFAAMVLAQLARRGSFVIGSSDVSFMEPATGAIGNFTSSSLADIAMHQVRRHLGIPSFTGFAGHSAARRFNQDAVWEISTSLMQAFFSRPATLDYLGSLDAGLTFSMQALCLTDEIAAMLRSMWQGIRVDPETMALELARQVGPRGNYLAQPHTVAHCREQLWAARYLGPHVPVSSGGAPDRDLFERIDADLHRLLAQHAPAPVAPELLARLAAIQAEFAAAHPL